MVAEGGGGAVEGVDAGGWCAGGGGAAVLVSREGRGSGVSEGWWSNWKRDDIQRWARRGTLAGTYRMMMGPAREASAQ